MQILVTVDNERPPEIQLSDVAQLVQDAFGSTVSIQPLTHLSALLVTLAAAREVNDVRARLKRLSPLIRDVMVDEPLVHATPWVSRSLSEST